MDEKGIEVRVVVTEESLRRLVEGVDKANALVEKVAALAPLLEKFGRLSDIASFFRKAPPSA